MSEPLPELQAVDPRIAALRDRGAQRLDPGGFQYLDALDRRLRLQPEGVLRQLLERRLADALAAFGERVDAACAELEQIVAEGLQRHPQAAAGLRRLQADRDIRAARRHLARLDAVPRGDSALAELLRHIDGHGRSDTMLPGDPAATTSASDTAPLAELKTVQRFRDTWTRLRVVDQLARSQQQVPDNPGPLNSHLLVLRTLGRMQALSPAYLDRFIAHVETLMWLDGAGLRLEQEVVAARPVARERGARKSKAGDRKT